MPRISSETLKEEHKKVEIQKEAYNAYVTTRAQSKMQLSRNVCEVLKAPTDGILVKWKTGVASPKYEDQSIVLTHQMSVQTLKEFLQEIKSQIGTKRMTVMWTNSEDNASFLRAANQLQMSNKICVIPARTEVTNHEERQRIIREAHNNLTSAHWDAQKMFNTLNK